MILRRVHLGLTWVLVAATSACSPDTEAFTVATTAQAVRAGTGTEGETYLGVDLLVTDEQDRGVPCGNGNVTVSFETSRNGDAGPWVAAGSQDIQLGCNDGRGDLALVLDNSGSLAEDVELLRAGVVAVRDQIFDSGGRMSLVRVSTESAVLVPLTKHAADIDAGIAKLAVKNGWTALWDGIRMGNETLGAELPWAQKGTQSSVASFCQAADKRAIVVFTDGGENNSSGGKLVSDSYPGDGIDTQLEDIEQLRVAGITTPVYVVGLGKHVDSSSLSAIARKSGGRYIGISSIDDVPGALAMIAEYFKTTHRACVELPVHQCGALDVRVTYSYREQGQSQGVKAQRLEQIYVPCPTRMAGRVATVLLTLEATDASRGILTQLVANTVNFVSPVDAPRVLFVRDDFTHGEYASDTVMLHQTLVTQGYSADFLEEPTNGISAAQLSNYDVVWFSNPGYGLDDQGSYEALRGFSAAGGGVVLQGDDMSMAFGNAFSMSEMTRLTPVDNGVTYCGVTINNGKKGSYLVTLGSDEHPLLKGIEGERFLYGDDIDTATVLDSQTTVLAWAVPVGAKKSCSPKPVVTVYSPGN